MERRQLLDQLVDLAQEAGLVVKTSPAGGPPSGTCRVRQEIWLVLAAADPVEERIAVVVDALRSHAGELLEGRYLPPALRDLLES